MDLSIYWGGGRPRQECTECYRGFKSMFGLGWPEVIVIAIVGILIFGPKKIPELGGALGKTLRGFKEEMDNPTPDDIDDERDY